MRRALAFVLLCACPCTSCRHHESPESDDANSSGSEAASTTGAGYAADVTDHDGVDSLGYGPRLAPRPVDTWRREKLSLADLVTNAKSGAPEGLLVVDVVEPLHAFAHPTYDERGRYRVDSRALHDVQLFLSPARSRRDLASGVIPALPRDLHPPVRVIATVTRDLPDVQPGTVREALPVYLPWTFLVRSVAPLSFPAPEPLPSPDVLLAPDAERWDRRYVTTTGDLWPGGSFGHGARVLDVPDAFMRCGREADSAQLRPFVHVRVTGLTHTSRDGGLRSAEITPTDIQRTDPDAPRCP